MRLNWYMDCLEFFLGETAHFFSCRASENVYTMFWEIPVDSNCICTSFDYPFVEGLDLR